MKSLLERVIWFLVAIVIGVFITLGDGAAADAQATPSPAPAAAPAAPGASASPSPSPAPTPTASPQFVTTYLDASAANLAGNGFFASGVPDRVFDTKHAGILVHTFNVTVQRVPSAGFGGRLEANVGNDANVIQSFPVSSNGLQHGVDLTQAYLTWTNGAGNFTFTAGKFVTLAGTEVIRSPDNANFSRGILFGYAIPFTHTGLRAAYTINPKITLIAGVNRGWDQLIGGLKTFEGAIDLTPTATTTLNIAGYSGNQSNQFPSGPNGTRSLIDIVGAWKPPGPIAWGINFDGGQQANVGFLNGAGAPVLTGPAPGVPQVGTAKWSGFAGYATYTLNPQLALTLRGETFADTNGFRTGLAQTWNEGTLTLQYSANPHLIVRGELRGDTSNVPAFAYVPANTVAKGQGSLALETIVRF